MRFLYSKKSDINNKEYQEHIVNEVVSVTRLVAVLGIIMFLGFYIVDFWAFSDTPPKELLFVRLAVAGILFIVLSCTYKPTIFSKFRPIILPIPYIVASMGITYMIMLANSSDYASQVYFVGLMLIIMMLFAWSFLHLGTTFAVSIFILGLYSYVEFTGKTAEDLNTVSHLLINLSFLIGSAIIGFFSQLIRDKHLKENFLLQKSLKDAYNRKSIEAKDNEYLANHDPLTDLPNRRHLTELLTDSLEIAATEDKILVIMFIDLNGFKQINDVYGHNAGDEVLVIVAKRLELAIRNGDHVSRLGGDEYVMGLMMEKHNLDEIETMANKFIDIISQPMNVEGLRVKVGASIGVAAYPIHGNNIEALIEIADQRMYQAKKRKTDFSFTDDTEIDEEQEAVVIFPGNAKKR